MNAYVIQDNDGTILSLHRTPDGVAHFILGHGDGATIAGKEIEIESIDRALAEGGTATAEFTDTTAALRFGYHAILV